MLRRALLGLLTGIVMMATSNIAAHATDGLLVPVGGGYADVYPGIVAAFLSQAHNGVVKITVLPTTYSTNPDSISQAEIEQNLRDAERRRLEIERACTRAAPADVTCTAEIAPVFTRTDAQNPAMLGYFGDDIAGVFILGGDQGVAMQVLAGSVVEDAIAGIYARGGIIAGTSAGGALQSRTMIADYAPNHAAGNSLACGAASVWNSATHRGLAFGAEDAVFDQHFFQRGRLGRLLGAIVQPGHPPIGVGFDGYTGARIDANGVLTGVFGLYTVAVLDAETYGAAHTRNDNTDCATLTARNVLVHLLAPGNFSYTIPERRPSLAAPPDAITRTLPGLAIPPGAGPLFLTGGIERGSPLWERFLDSTGSSAEPLLIVATGHANDRPAQRAAERLGEQLGSAYTVDVVSVKSQAPLTIEQPYRGIIVLARDQSRLEPARLTAIKDAWLAGTPLLLDGAAAALAGTHFSAHAPTPEEAEAAEIASQRSFLAGRTIITDALGLLDATFEPQLLADNRWGRVFSLAFTHPNTVTVGIAGDTALLLTQDGAVNVGDNAIVSLDLREATLALGKNDAYVIANGLLDVFAPGDDVRLEQAERIKMHP